jgi:SAM-dependent methyltransferase
MDPRYGAQYARLYREHWWWRAREEYLTRLLDRVVGANGAGETFDFGCGDGLFFPILQRYGAQRPRGLEPDASLLDPAGPWFDRITTGALVDEPAERARYGLIVALDVLEHLEDPQPAMAILRARLRPGGWFIATVPAFDELWTAHDEVNHHYRRYRRRDLEALVRASGLTIVESRYCFVWVALGKWLVARKERVIRPVVKPPEVPAAPLNAVALALTRLEQRIVGDTHPPFGSSVVVVARAPLLGSATEPSAPNAAAAFRSGALSDRPHPRP